LSQEQHLIFNNQVYQWMEKGIPKGFPCYINFPNLQLKLP